MIVVFCLQYYFFANRILDKKADISISAFGYKIYRPKTVTSYNLNNLQTLLT